MFKLAGALTSGLATIIVLPSVALDDYRATSLRAALEETVLAIDTLKGVRTGLDEGADPNLIDRVLELTEPPPVDQRELDELLVITRDEVGRLQQQVDILEARRAGVEFRGSVYAPTPGGTTIGIDANLLRTLNSIGSSGTEGRGPMSPLAGGMHGYPGSDSLGPGDHGTGTLRAPTEPLEAKGYSADPLAQAVAAYRAKRYTDALIVLGEPREDAHLWFWRARILDAVDRLDDARLAYAKVIELDPESFDAKQAAVEVEFLEWRQKFESKLPTKQGGGAQSGAVAPK
jgi:hypothetical protein